MFNKVRISFVNNLSIKSKLFTGLVVMALLPIVALTLSWYGFNQYQGVVDAEGRADEIKTLLSREQNGIVQFLGGETNGSDIYTEAHSEFLEVKTGIELTSSRRRRRVDSIIEGEQYISAQMFADGGGLLEEFGTAKQEFVDQNNKHVGRLLGYKDSWVAPRGTDNTQVLGILDDIRRERILVDDFNARSSDASVVSQEFRDTNDQVVERVLTLWQQELDVGIARASSPTLKSKLQAVRRIVGDATATSFPPISSEDAKLLGIAGNKEPVYGLEARSATESLTTAIETSINDYEKDGGIPLWPRADVTEVGEDVTPTHVLSKLVSCQQGLRVNAEQIFKWKTRYVDDIEPTFLKISSNLDLYLDSLSASVAGRARQVRIFSIVASGVGLVLAVLLMVLFAKVIVKPISIMRDTAVELALGHFSRRAPVKTGDEIGTLAVAFNEMINELEKSIDRRDSEIAKRKGVEEALREANEKLEIRVEERTTALIVANQHLLQEIAERERAQNELRDSSQQQE